MTNKNITQKVAQNQQTDKGGGGVGVPFPDNVLAWQLVLLHVQLQYKVQHDQPEFSPSSRTPCSFVLPVAVLVVPFQCLMKEHLGLFQGRQRTFL